MGDAVYPMSWAISTEGNGILLAAGVRLERGNDIFIDCRTDIFERDKRIDFIHNVYKFSLNGLRKAQKERELVPIKPYKISRETKPKRRPWS